MKKHVINRFDYEKRKECENMDVFAILTEEANIDLMRIDGIATTEMELMGLSDDTFVDYVYENKFTDFVDTVIHKIKVFCKKMIDMIQEKIVTLKVHYRLKRVEDWLATANFQQDSIHLDKDAHNRKGLTLDQYQKEIKKLVRDITKATNKLRKLAKVTDAKTYTNMINSYVQDLNDIDKKYSGLLDPSSIATLAGMVPVAIKATREEFERYDRYIMEIQNECYNSLGEAAKLETEILSRLVDPEQAAALTITESSSTQASKASAAIKKGITMLSSYTQTAVRNISSHPFKALSALESAVSKITKKVKGGDKK